MFFEAPLLATLSHPRTSENDDMATKRTQGRVSSTAGAGKRRRAASTSLPLKSLCLNQESSLNLESIFNYLPATARLNRNSWNAASFKQFKSKATPSHPRSTSSPSSPPPVPTASTTVSSLPTELLCLVFDSYSSVSPSDGAGDCAPDPETHPYGFFSVSRDCVRTPLPLTQVCQRWRSAAIGHKTLWGSISLALQGPVEEDEEDSPRFHRWAQGKTELLKLFLSRSRGVPLSLALSSSEETPQSAVAEVLQWVCRHAGQWQDVRMDLGSVSAVQVLLDGLSFAVAHTPKSTFGLLRNLHLDLAVDDDDDDDEYDDERMLSSRLVVKDVYEIILRRSPNLSELVLDDLFFIWGEGGDYGICPSYERRCTDNDDGRDVVPWYQLKKLTINSNSISARKVLGICAKAMKLEELKLWRVGCDGASDVDLWDSPADVNVSSSPLTSIVLPHLRSLDLTLVTEPAQLLGALSTPALRRVDIDVQAIRNPLRTFDQAPVASILAPLNRLLESTSTTVDVRCGVKLLCVLPEEGLNTQRMVNAAWMEAQGLHALARSGKCVEVYKFASSRST